MRIRLLAFASAADALGASQSDFEMPDGSTAADLRAALGRGYPAMRELWPRLALAVDGAIVGDATPLADGGEVALLPPVSGG